MIKFVPVLEVLNGANMVSVPSQRVTYFSNTLLYGELLSLKPAWRQILALIKSTGILP